MFSNRFSNRLFKSHKYTHPHPHVLSIHTGVDYANNDEYTKIFEGLYHQLQTAIMDEITRAQRERKKIVMIAGEKHGDPNCMLVEILLLFIANQMCIQHVYVEKTKAAVLAYKDKYHSETKDALLDSKLKNSLKSFFLMKKLFPMMQIDGIEDPRRNLINFLPGSMRAFGLSLLTLDHVMCHRDKYMAEEIKAANTDCVVFNGVAHLKGIIENLATDTRLYPIGINLSGVNADVLPSLTNAHKQRIIYALTSEKVKQIQIPSFDDRVVISNHVIPSLYDFCDAKLKSELLKPEIPNLLSIPRRFE